MSEQASEGNRGCPILGDEADFDFESFREMFATYVKKGQYKIFVDVPPPEPDPIDIANYANPAGGMNASHRRIHDAVVANRAEYVASEKRGTTSMMIAT